MRIATSTLYSNATTAMTALQSQADTLSTQISTGSKISKASDDPLASARLALLSKNTANNKAWTANISLAQTLVAQSDSTLESVQTQMTRAQELAVQANSGTLSDANKQSIATELQGILASLGSLANTKDARGQPLFGGSGSESAVAVASDGSVSITATGNPSSIPIGDGSSIQATDSAAKVFGGVTTAGGGTSDVFSIVSNLISAVQSGGDIGSAATDLTAAAQQITDTRASLGARGNRLDMEATAMTSTATSNEALRSSLEDTDVTAAVSELQKTMTILSATQASFTKLTSLSLFTYLS
jgi:flagellar hook-associated protein 3 FlgL